MEPMHNPISWGTKKAPKIFASSSSENYTRSCNINRSVLSLVFIVKFEAYIFIKQIFVNSIILPYSTIPVSYIYFKSYQIFLSGTFLLTRQNARKITTRSKIFAKNKQIIIYVNMFLEIILDS